MGSQKSKIVQGPNSKQLNSKQLNSKPKTIFKNVDEILKNGRENELLRFLLSLNKEDLKENLNLLKAHTNNEKIDWSALTSLYDINGDHEFILKNIHLGWHGIVINYHTKMEELYDKDIDWYAVSSVITHLDSVFEYPHLNWNWKHISDKYFNDDWFMKRIEKLIKKNESVILTKPLNVFYMTSFIDIDFILNNKDRNWNWKEVKLRSYDDFLKLDEPIKKMYVEDILLGNNKIS